MADDTIANGGRGADAPAPHDGPAAAGADPQRAPAAPDYGNVKLQSVLSQMRIAALAAPANDNADAGTDGVQASGFEAAIFHLSSGSALLTWVGSDGHAHGHLHAPAEEDTGRHWIDPPEYAAVNAALGDLGPVVPALHGARRIQTAELQPGTFALMWLTLAETGLAARGKLLSAPAGDTPGSAGDTHWVERPIEDVALPGFARGFRVAGAGGEANQILVSYETTEATQCVIVVSAARGDAKEPGPHETGLPAAQVALASGETDGMPAEPGTKDTDVPLAGSPETPAREALAAPEAPATNKAAPAAPAITALAEGFAVGRLAPGDSEGVTQFKLTLYDQHGIAKKLADGSTVLLVGDNVAADTAPAVSGFGNGLAVAYKHGGNGGLVVKMYNATGSQVGEQVVAGPSDAGTIRDIATSSIDVGDEDGGHQDQLAVAYTVECADGDARAAGEHYGTIMLQRLGVEDEGDHSRVVALGRDGERDGDDAPAALMIETGGAPTPVIGRDPRLAGLDNGELAIVWVENDGTRETIKGGVLELDGEQVLRLDLTGLIEDEGIVRGTRPSLLDAGGGDILVSWLQHDGDDDYAVMAALYDSAAPGVWIEPENPIRLKTFDDEPDDYSVSLSHTGGLSILVTWEEDSSGHGSGDRILTQRFDLSGDTLSAPAPVASGSADAQQPQAPSGGLAAAGLADGQIVVVYAGQGSDGGLTAHVVDVDDLLGAENEGSSAGGATEAAAAEPSSTGTDALFSTLVDQEIAIDVLAGKPDAGFGIARVNGAAIDTATPIDVGSAWVQLREDGRLTVCPNAGYSGPITFEYTLASAAGGETTNSVTVSVAAPETQAGVLPFNRATSLAEHVSLPAGQGEEVAGGHDRAGTEALSAAGLDADMFTIVGSTLYLKAGVELEFETRQRTGQDTSADMPLDGASAAVTGDGNKTASGSNMLFSPNKDDADDSEDMAEPASSGYALFRRLLDSGALAQVGDDVVITLDAGDPANPHTITLRGVSLSTLTDPEFRFS